MEQNSKSRVWFLEIIAVKTFAGWCCEGYFLSGGSEDRRRNIRVAFDSLRFIQKKVS